MMLSANNNPDDHQPPIILVVFFGEKKANGAKIIDMKIVHITKKILKISERIIIINITQTQSSADRLPQHHLFVWIFQPLSQRILL